MNFDWISDPQSWIAFGTLAALEIVLGIDNIIFISILSGKLPEHQRAKARNIGLALAMFTRILLLLSLSWIMGLTADLFHIPFLDSIITPTAEGHGHSAVSGSDAATSAAANGAATSGHSGTFGSGVSEPVRNREELTSTPGGISGRDLILLLGGLFLLVKSVHEIHHKLEGEEHGTTSKAVASFGAIIVQILLLDIVFSLDSVITAVGMVSNIAIMISAVVLAVGVMLVAAGPISSFVEKHPTVKMLALSFLLLIGFTLICEGLQIHIPKGFVYFAMGFSVFVEMLNLKLRKKSAPEPIHLRHP